MSFILIRTDEVVESFNAWNWKPLTLLLYRARLVDKDTFEGMQYNVGTEISSDQATAIADYLDSYIDALAPNTRRLMFDLTESDTEDDGTLYRDPADYHRNYSVTVQSLREMRDFCRPGRAFIVS